MKLKYEQHMKKKSVIKYPICRAGDCMSIGKSMFYSCVPVSCQGVPLSKLICSYSIISILGETFRALTNFKLQGEVTSLSGSSEGEVVNNREKQEDFREKLMGINQNIVLGPLPTFSIGIKLSDLICSVFLFIIP